LLSGSNAHSMSLTLAESLFGRKAVHHPLFAEHLTAEYRVRIEDRGRAMDGWKLPHTSPTTTGLDCLVGCAAGASVQGTMLYGTGPGKAQNPMRIRLSEVQKRRRR